MGWKELKEKAVSIDAEKDSLSGSRSTWFVAAEARQTREKGGQIKRRIVLVGGCKVDN
jgi:hypothetical protein